MLARAGALISKIYALCAARGGRVRELGDMPGGIPYSATVGRDGKRVVSVNVWRLRAR
jgi:hypothetical protein